MLQNDGAQDLKLLEIETDVVFPESQATIKLNKYNDKNSNKNIKTMSYLFFKRTFDIVASASAILALSPIFLVTSIAIRKDSNGPAMFTQSRIGKDGKLFKLYKFRTMVPDADTKLVELLEKDENAREEYKLNKKLKNDPRVTRVGKFLRSTSIDELPQLINVLKGDMSLVGPRPYLPREMDDMGEYYDTIVESKPGITGLWQVSGRSNTTFEKRLEYDVEYNDNKGFFYDMNLLTKTVGVVIGKDGAE